MQDFYTDVMKLHVDRIAFFCREWAVLTAEPMRLTTRDIAVCPVCRLHLQSPAKWMIHVHTAHPEYVDEERELPDAQRLRQIQQARFRLAQKQRKDGEKTTQEGPPGRGPRG
jgi:hypothetical protein